MKYNEYLQACLSFASDSQAWDSKPHGFFTTTGDGYTETCDNSVGGIDVSWAFKLSPEKVREYAPQEFMDACTDQLALILDDFGNDANQNFLQHIYDLFV